MWLCDLGFQLKHYTALSKALLEKTKVEDMQAQIMTMEHSYTYDLSLLYETIKSPLAETFFLS